jgi:hypothetical protein
MQHVSTMTTLLILSCLYRAAAVFEPPGKVTEAAAEDDVTRALGLAFLAAETEAMTEAASSGINPGGAVAVAALQIGQVRVCNLFIVTIVYFFSGCDMM